jgi:hypothetical protein
MTATDPHSDPRHEPDADRPEETRRAVLTAVRAEGGQATTRRLVAVTGQPYADRSPLRVAVDRLTATGQLTGEPVSDDDVCHTRWLLTDLGRTVLGQRPTEPARLRAAAAAMHDAASWAEDMAAGGPFSGGYDDLVDLMARALARMARAAVDGGHLAVRAEMVRRVSASADALFASYPDDQRLDQRAGQ